MAEWKSACLHNVQAARLSPYEHPQCLQQMFGHREIHHLHSFHSEKNLLLLSTIGPQQWLHKYSSKLRFGLILKLALVTP